jgi:glutamate/tyrosine decarboxylase-like PLP-dependent enzyme
MAAAEPSAHSKARALREAFADLAGIDGAEAPGADALLPLRPRVLSSRTLEQVASLAEKLWPIFDTEVRRAIASSGAAKLARSLGFPSYEAKLIASTPSILPPPVRADFVPTQKGYRLVEWNVDPCLGGLAGRTVFDCFARAGATQDLFFRDPAKALVPSFASLAGKVRGVLVAIREFDLPNWRLNAERFAEIAREAGLEARVITLERLAHELPETSDLPWGIVRYFHIEHTRDARNEVASLLTAARNGKVKVLYGFDTELFGDKQWLAHAAPKLKSNLARAVAETRIPSEITTTLLKNKDRWVLKPHAGAAGEGVKVGREHTASEWRALAQQSTRKSGWVAQRLVVPQPTYNEYMDVETGQVIRRKEIETLGIFLVEGRYAGAYVRSIPVGAGIVVDASSNFNVVATRQPTPRTQKPGARKLALPHALRDIWSTPSRPAMTRRLRTFEGLALTHLTGRKNNLKDAIPSRASRGFLRPQIAEKGESISAIVRSLRDDLLPFCHDKRDPGYVAHLDVPPADLSIATGVLLRAIAQDPVTWTSSRAGTFMEQEVLRWLAGLVFSLAEHTGGVACSGGTQANLHAMLIARNLALPDVIRLGMATALRNSGARSMKVLASSATHGSVNAAVRHAGIGEENLISLPVDSSDSVSLDALEQALERASRNNDKVAMVVLNAGTVGVGAIDPLPDAIAIAKRYGARVHVDAAHGSVLLFSRRYATRLAGIELADSVVADPHKILGLNQGLGVLLLRNIEDAAVVMKDPSPYFSTDPNLPSFARFTLDGTRPLHALGAWILMRHLGRTGYEQVVDHLVALTDRFVAGLEETGAFELYSRPPMNLVAFRRTIPYIANISDVSDSYGVQGILRQLSRYQSPRGDFLRAVFVNPATTGKEIDDLLEILARS